MSGSNLKIQNNKADISLEPHESKYIDIMLDWTLTNNMLELKLFLV